MKAQSAKTEWPLQDAKAHFSELVDAALTQGPQAVTRHGKNAVVVLSHHDFVRLSQANTTLADALGGAPAELTFERDRTPIPAVQLD